MTRTTQKLRTPLSRGISSSRFTLIVLNKLKIVSSNWASGFWSSVTCAECSIRPASQQLGGRTPKRILQGIQAAHQLWSAPQIKDRLSHRCASSPPPGGDAQQNESPL